MSYIILITGIKKLLVIGLIVVTLTGCAQKVILETNSCVIFGIIKPSVKDTKDTILQVEDHNDKYLIYCGEKI